MSEELKKRAGKILVVDDDSTSLLLMRAALRKSGFDVTMAASGAEALRLFRAESLDIEKSPAPQRYSVLSAN